MKLSIINGSPRAKSGNTEKLLEQFTRGFTETPGNTVETIYAIRERPDFTAAKAMFLQAENLLLAFPLYVDAMPGSVKELIEAWEPLQGQNPRLNLLFLCQCGFPETHHVRYVERYCEKLAKRLGAAYGGMICKGGCEGLAMQPPKLVDKIYLRCYQLGQTFGQTGELAPELLASLAYPEHLPPANMQPVIDMVNQYLWDAQMKANDVLERSFDKPYE